MRVDFFLSRHGWRFDVLELLNFLLASVDQVLTCFLSGSRPESPSSWSFDILLPTLVFNRRLLIRLLHVTSPHRKDKWLVDRSYSSEVYGARLAKGSGGLSFILASYKPSTLPNVQTGLLSRSSTWAPSLVKRHEKPWSHIRETLMSGLLISAT